MAIESEEIVFTYDRLTKADLTPEELGDLEVAIAGRENAYAPYSKFCVGAALRTGNDVVYPGWNTENVGYAALHAEHSAVGRMLAIDRETGLVRVTVIGGPKEGGGLEPVTPCGDCRQKMLEHVLPGQNPSVIMAGIRGDMILRANLRDLLPLGFFPACLKS